MEREKIVVAFDGECLLCSRSLRFLAARDPRARLRFVKLQSALGRRLREMAGDPWLDSMVVAADGRTYVRSAAALRLLREMSGGWPLLGALGRLLPPRLRDAAYDFLAARRHRWFGRGDACALPPDSVRERLLDGDRV